MEHGADDWEERPGRTWIWDRRNFCGLLRELRCYRGRKLGGLFEEGRKGNFPYLDSINRSPDFASATTVCGERGLTDVSAEWCPGLPGERGWKELHLHPASGRIRQEEVA